MSESSLRSNFLQEIEKLKKIYIDPNQDVLSRLRQKLVGELTDAESKQVKVLEQRGGLAVSKMVRERSMSQWE